VTVYYYKFSPDSDSEIVLKISKLIFGKVKARAGGRTPAYLRAGGSRMLRGLMLRMENFS